MILIDSKRKKPETILKKYPNAILIDVTSKGKDEFVKLSPFYPHSGIPVPFSEGYTATCVEAIWQGLKVFEKNGIDINLFKNDTMRNLKRTVRKFGKPLGHQKGVGGKKLLGYIEARKLIYIPSYFWVLENKVQDIVHKIAQNSKTKTIILLDYNVNDDVENTKTPLSHASLIKKYIESLNQESQPINDNLNSEVKKINKQNRKRKIKDDQDKEITKKVKSVDKI